MYGPKLPLLNRGNIDMLYQFHMYHVMIWYLYVLQNDDHKSLGNIHSDT